MNTLNAGDKVDVSLTNGVVAHFVVRTVATYSKTAFPAAQVYASQGYSALQLVTSSDGTARIWNTTIGTLSTVLAGGTGPVNAVAFNPNNVVAYTTLVSTTPAGKK